ncbi:MAG: hypothetical protein AB8B92_02770 [Gammaproteobacteria bacterium]
MAINPIINDRRNRPERRSGGVINQFPILTEQGLNVRKDRRAIPERRISNIVVKEWFVKESIFKTLFQSKGKVNKK